jgi:hypothetical protein
VAGIARIAASAGGGLGTGRDASADVAAAIDIVVRQLATEPAPRSVLAAWSLVRSLGRLAFPAGGPEDEDAVARTSRAWLDELRLAPVIAGAFRGLDLDEGAAWRAVDLVRVLVALPRRASVAGAGWPPGGTRPGARARGTLLSGVPLNGRIIEAWLVDVDVRPFIRVNVWEGVAWFEKEAFEALTAWMLVLDAVEAVAAPSVAAGGMTAPETAGPSVDGIDVHPTVSTALRASVDLVRELRATAEESGYRVDRLAAASGPAIEIRPRASTKPKPQATSKPRTIAAVKPDAGPSSTT